MPLEVPELASGNPQLQRAMVKLVKAEQKVIDKFEQKSTKVEDKLKIVKDVKTKYSELKDALMPFRTPGDFRELMGVSTHPDVLNVASIDKEKAAPGSFEFEILSTANSDSIMTYGFADRNNTQVGVGYISFMTPEGEEREVYINSDNNTLDGVAAAINKAGVGLKAFVVHDGTDSEEPWRLMFTSQGTGWKKDFEYPEFHFLDGDMDLDLYRQRDAKSAAIKFNGMPLYLDENKIKELIPGVSVDIRKAQPGQEIRIDIKPDIEKIEGKAKNLVDKMNALLGVFSSQSQLNEKSRSDPTKALAGDITFMNSRNTIRQLVQETRNELSETQIQLLRDVGIVFNRNGSLDFDGKKFQAKLEENFDEVSSLFAGTSVLGGFATKMIGHVDGMNRIGDGIMTMREKNLSKNKDQIAKEKERAEEKAASRLERAKLQFGRVEAAIQNMQQMQSGIGQMLPSGGG